MTAGILSGPTVASPVPRAGWGQHAVLYGNGYGSSVTARLKDSVSLSRVGQHWCNWNGDGSGVTTRRKDSLLSRVDQDAAIIRERCSGAATRVNRLTDKPAGEGRSDDRLVLRPPTHSMSARCTLLKHPGLSTFPPSR